MLMYHGFFPGWFGFWGFGWPLMAAIAVIPFWRICTRVGHSPWLSLLILIPLVNLNLPVHPRLRGMAGAARRRPAARRRCELLDARPLSALPCLAAPWGPQGTRRAALPLSPSKKTAPLGGRFCSALHGPCAQDVPIRSSETSADGGR